MLARDSVHVRRVGVGAAHTGKAVANVNCFDSHTIDPRDTLREHIHTWLDCMKRQGFSTPPPCHSSALQSI